MSLLEYCARLYNEESQLRSRLNIDGVEAVPKDVLDQIILFDSMLDDTDND